MISVPETLVGLMLAGMAIYGLGIPLALLLPAPEEAQWTFRIAVAPLYSITLSSLAAAVLSVLNVPLDPMQLWLLVVAAWAVAIAGARCRAGVGVAVHSMIVPGLVVLLGAVGWLLSVIGYGLYLPARDFKRHATWVAQVASEATSDSSLVLRDSPIAPPSEGAIYPHGLHTVLGWILPKPDWSSVAITASSAVLVASISLPLGMWAMARTWNPASAHLAPLVALFAVALPGLMWPFQYGSVTLLVATSTYSAALVALWMWLDDPTMHKLGGVAIAGMGLFLLHVSEAIALALVGALSVPLVLSAHRRQAEGRRPNAAIWTGVVGGLVLAALVLKWGGFFDRITELAGTSDFSPNDVEPWLSVFFPFVVIPWGFGVLTLVWLSLVVFGAYLALRHGLSVLPLVALAVPLVLSVSAMGEGLPGWLTAFAVPWYGQGARVALLAGPPLVLLGCHSMVCLFERAQGQVSRSRRILGSLVVEIACLTLLLVAISDVVPMRRQNMSATLAGAGDTQDLARSLSAELTPGEAVLGFEGDGTELLFAHARVPLLTDPWLATRLGRLSDPGVARAMDALRLRFVAMGTTSIYWGQKPGYSVERLLRQPQLSLAAQGTDMVILRYEGGRGE